jgi:hypothetical protein
MSLPTQGQWDEVDKTGLPDVHTLELDRLIIFWVLAVAKRLDGLGHLAASEVSIILRDYCGIALSRQRVAGLLQSETKAVARVAKSEPPRYLIMKQGEDELSGSGFRPLFIDPQKALTGIRAVEDLLSGLTGDLSVCDTYVDSRTLDYLARCSSASSIRLLTENVQDSTRFKRDLAAFAKEHAYPLEVRIAAAGQFHDRYVLYPAGMYLLGSSLKDIGKKQSIVVALPPDFSREMGKAFGRLWVTAKKI